jgi:Ran GTPase-activating protein (RanGAP) involved in mRNA processing and transport
LTLSNVIQTPDPTSIKFLLSGAKQCTTLRNLDISANQGSNSAIPELISLVTSLVQHLRTLNISKLGLSSKNVAKVHQALIEQFGKDFNLTSTLRVLRW